MIYKFTNTNGIPMAARLALKGDRYGRDGCLTVNRNPLIEFYALTDYDHNNPWLKEQYQLDGFPYFISNYTLSTYLFGWMGQSRLDNGLCLEGSTPQYNLTAEECRNAILNLFYQLANKEPA